MQGKYNVVYSYQFLSNAMRCNCLAYDIYTVYSMREELVINRIDNQLNKFFSGINDSHTEFINVSDICPVDFLLHHSTNSVTNRI